MTPYQVVMRALDEAGFGGIKPKCPTCPSGKRRGFSVTQTEDTVLVKCHRGCSTVDEILAALGLSVDDLFSGKRRGAQTSLFSGERYSAVTLAGYRALAPSSARDFSIATCLARYLHMDGTFAPVAKAADIRAYVITKRLRKAAREECKVSPGRWRHMVQDWCRRSMAHRCSLDDTCLFRAPEPACPYCGTVLEEQAAPEGSPPSDALVIELKERLEEKALPKGAPSDALELDRTASKSILGSTPNSKEHTGGRNPTAFEHDWGYNTQAVVMRPLGGRNATAFGQARDAFDMAMQAYNEAAFGRVRAPKNAQPTNASARSAPLPRALPGECWRCREPIPVDTPGRICRGCVQSLADRDVGPLRGYDGEKALAYLAEDAIRRERPSVKHREVNAFRKAHGESGAVA